MSRLPLSEILFGLPQPRRLKARRDVAGLIRILSTVRYGPHLRGEAAKALAELRDSASIEALIAALRDDDARLGAEAAEALGVIGDPRAVEPLIEVLGHSEGDVLKAVARALAGLKDPRAVLPLLARRDAHWALTQLGDLAIPPLIDALADPELRGQALALMTPAARDAAGVPHAPSFLGGSAVAPLVAALDNPEPGIRGGAAYLLGRLGDRFGEGSRRAIEPLAARLGDEDEEVRRTAAFALAEFHDPRAVAPLLRLMQGADRQVIFALGCLGDARAIAPLVALLGDGREEIRHEAASALERLGWQPADDRERAALAVAMEDWDRAASLGSSALEPLVAMLGTADHGVQAEAAKVLRTLGWSPPDAQRRILLAIAAGDWDEVAGHGPAAVEPLAATVAERPRWIRWGHNVDKPATLAPWQAAHLLAEMGDPRGVAATVRQLEISFERVASVSRRLEGLMERLTDPHDAADFGVAEAEEEQRETVGLAKRQVEDLVDLGTDGQAAFARLLHDTRVAIPDFVRPWYEERLRCRGVPGQPAAAS